jgi:hypothetical protein
MMIVNSDGVICESAPKLKVIARKRSRHYAAPIESIRNQSGCNRSDWPESGQDPTSSWSVLAGLIAHGPRSDRQLAGESRAGRPIGSQGRPLVRKV